VNATFWPEMQDLVGGEVPGGVCVFLYSLKLLSEIGGGTVDFPPGPLGQHQPACKPGSVDEGEAPSRDGHSSATPVARRLKQPTRTAARTRVET